MDTRRITPTPAPATQPMCKVCGDGKDAQWHVAALPSPTQRGLAHVFEAESA